MLLRIRRPMAGTVDGIDLSQFESGAVYRIATELACYLLALGAADPVDADTDPARLPASKRLFADKSDDRPRSFRWMGPERRRNAR